MWHDVERLCAGLGLPFRKPDPFPQPSLLAARIALIGLPQGWGEDFARAVYRAEFGDGRQIGDAAVMAEILSSLDLDAAAILARAQGDEIKAELRGVTEQAQRLGFSARRASSPRTGSCSGATTGWSRRWPGRSSQRTHHDVRAQPRRAGGVHAGSPLC